MAQGIYNKPKNLEAFLEEGKRHWELASKLGLAEPWDKAEERLRMIWTSIEPMNQEQYETMCEDQAQVMQPVLQNLQTKLDSWKNLLEAEAKEKTEGSKR